MNIKGFVIALGMLALVGSCAALGACAYVQDAIETHAVQAEYLSFDLSLEGGTGHKTTGLIWQEPLGNSMVMEDDGWYSVENVTVEYYYFFDPSQPTNTTVYVNDITYYVSYWGDYNPQTFYSPCWYIENDVANDKYSVIANATDALSLYSYVPTTIFTWDFFDIAGSYPYPSNYPQGLQTYPMTLVYSSLMLEDYDYRFIGGRISNWLHYTYEEHIWNSAEMIRRAFIEGSAQTHDFDWDAYNELVAEAEDLAYRRGYNAGLSASSDSTEAIANLFGAIWNVPVNVINGLSPLVIWNTPIVSILLTFLVLAIIVFIIRKFI